MTCRWFGVKPNSAIIWLAMSSRAVLIGSSILPVLVGVRRFLSWVVAGIQIRRVALESLGELGQRGVPRPCSGFKIRNCRLRDAGSARDFGLRDAELLPALDDRLGCCCIQ